jgi:hypothetical protein
VQASVVCVARTKVAASSGDIIEISYDIVANVMGSQPPRLTAGLVYPAFLDNIVPNHFKPAALSASFSPLLNDDGKEDQQPLCEPSGPPK